METTMRVFAVVVGLALAVATVGPWKFIIDRGWRSYDWMMVAATCGAMFIVYLGVFGR